LHGPIRFGNLRPTREMTYASSELKHESSPCRLVFTIAIGNIPIRLHVDDERFLELLRDRYRGFESQSDQPVAEFDITLQPLAHDPDEDLDVRIMDDAVNMVRGDFRAEWNMNTGHGRIEQAPSPYAIDSVLRIVYSLLLVERGGFLVHSASAIAGPNAYLFAGPSGSGKTTMCRLASDSVHLLSDEISFVLPDGGGYRAFGTPFYGELARPGEPISAPLAAMFILRHAPENHITTLARFEALHAVMRNILFFAKEPLWVQRVLAAAIRFVDSVTIKQMEFLPNPEIWKLVA
jgi:hypothetical protein